MSDSNKTREELLQQIKELREVNKLLKDNQIKLEKALQLTRDITAAKIAEQNLI